MTAATIKIETRSLCFFYQGKQVLHNVSLKIPEFQITSITGPSGSGKSTFLTVLNRLWEEVDACSVTGTVMMNLKGRLFDIHSNELSVADLRRNVGMVFQQPNPLPMSIAKNVSFPLRLSHRGKGNDIGDKVEMALRQVRLWEEVKDRLNEDGRMLSGGQQQRLCLARALILEPEVLLLDEPTSSLDQEAGAAIEELLLELKKRCTLVLVSHYHDQIHRISDNQIRVADGCFSWE